MILNILLIASILLGGLIFGVYWGPWIALTRTLAALPAEAFLPVTHRMGRNLAPLMSALFPVTLLAIVATTVFAFGQPVVFVLALVALVLFALTLVVTMTIEVPIVARIADWTLDTLPANWEAQRDRWVSFHLLRVIPGFLGFVALVVGLLLAR